MMNATEHYLDQYRAHANALPGRGVDWLQAQRGAGLARFEQVGFPTERDEDWRYTTTKPITAKLFRAPNMPQLESTTNESAIESRDIESVQIENLKTHRLVFVDGLFAPQLSDHGEPTSGVMVDSLARVLEDRPELIEHAFGALKPEKAHGFTALNHAYSQDGVVVLLSANVCPTLPLEMLFISHAEDGFAQPRNLIIAEQNSKASVIERYVSLNGATNDHNTFTNSTTEILLAEKSEIDYYLMQTQSRAACHVCGIWARQSAGSRFSCRTLTFGGALVRNDLAVELSGEHAHADMLGLYHIGGTQHVDNHTTMVHAAENCSSRELYKGVLEQRSRAVFHGRIVVEPGAQKTNAAQTNNNLLLSKHAEIDTKPQLEIYADDVKCSHGATVGQMDDDALFYLRTRGIDEPQARALLTFAFVNDVVQEIGISELKQSLENKLAASLTQDNTIQSDLNNDSTPVQ